MFSPVTRGSHDNLNAYSFSAWILILILLSILDRSYNH